MGLFHIVYSSVLEKKGSINLSFTACRDMMPDPGFYTTCLQESFDELKNAALKTARKKPKAKVKKARVKKKVARKKAAK